MNRILSIDPSGTGTSGVCFINEGEKQFSSFQSKEWKKHLEFFVEKVKELEPDTILYEHTNFISLKGKDMTALLKLFGGIESLRYVYPSLGIKSASVAVNQVKSLKDKLLNGNKTIRGLKFAKGRGKGWSLNGKKINIHELDALLVYFLGKENYLIEPIIDDLPEDHECERECPYAPCIECGEYEVREEDHE